MDGMKAEGARRKRRRVPIRSPVFLIEWERDHHPPSTVSDSLAGMSLLMTTFIQIRLIVIIVNN